MCYKILLVDDDICLAYAIQSYLSSKDKNIFIVDDSSIAIKLLNLYDFDLVISDIMMPFMDGYEFLKEVRHDMRLSKIPFIFLTAKGMTSDRIKGYNLGCNVYLTKPFHPSELMSIVNNILSSKNLLLKVNSLTNDSSQIISNSILDLTNKERSVLELLAKGMMNKEIAVRLKMSQRNVEKYVSRLLNKTSTRNRTELARSPILSLIRANDGTRTRE